VLSRLGRTSEAILYFDLIVEWAFTTVISEWIVLSFPTCLNEMRKPLIRPGGQSGSPNPIATAQSLFKIGLWSSRCDRRLIKNNRARPRGCVRYNTKDWLRNKSVSAQDQKEFEKADEPTRYKLPEPKPVQPKNLKHQLLLNKKSLITATMSLGHFWKILQSCFTDSRTRTVKFLLNIWRGMAGERSEENNSTPLWWKAISMFVILRFRLTNLISLRVNW